jgi:hypothetical protein
MAKEHLAGDEHTVSPCNSVDQQQASTAAAASDLLEKQQLDVMDEVFGPTSVSPDRSSRATYIGRPSIGSSLRSNPYTQKPFRSEFYQRDGKEYQKSHFECDKGHIPKFGNDIPFSLYNNTPSNACLHNDANKYLSWDHSKSKYCCQAEPDSNETIMVRSKQVVYNMATRVSIDQKTLSSLNYAIAKYLKYYGLVHPDTLDQEKQKMSRLRRTFLTHLTGDRGEPKSRRMERDAPLTSEAATEMFNIMHPSSEGGRSKKRNSKFKSKSRKSKSKRTKSRKSKRRC